MKLALLMVTCRERDERREETLADLAASDWGKGPDVIVRDDESASAPPFCDARTWAIHRIRDTWRRAIAVATSQEADAILCVEDDLRFSKHLWHNLQSWLPLVWLRGGGPYSRDPGHLWASLYDPGLERGVVNLRERYFVPARPGDVYGAQAIIIGRLTAQHVRDRWDAPGAGTNPDEKIARLASERTTLLYHLPSLVDHVQGPSTWGAVAHQAKHFDLNWRA